MKCAKHRQYRQKASKFPHHISNPLYNYDLEELVSVCYYSYNAAVQTDPI